MASRFSSPRSRHCKRFTEPKSELGEYTPLWAEQRERPSASLPSAHCPKRLCQHFLTDPPTGTAEFTEPVFTFFRQISISIVHLSATRPMISVTSRSSSGSDPELPPPERSFSLDNSAYFLGKYNSFGCLLSKLYQGSHVSPELSKRCHHDLQQQKNSETGGTGYWRGACRSSSSQGNQLLITDASQS